MPGTAHCCPASACVLKPTPADRPQSPHWTDEEAEAQREDVTCPSTHGPQRRSGDFKSSSSDNWPAMVTTHPLAQEKGRIWADRKVMEGITWAED